MRMNFSRALIRGANSPVHMRLAYTRGLVSCPSESFNHDTVQQTIACIERYTVLVNISTHSIIKKQFEYCFMFFFVEIRTPSIAV